MYYNIQTDKLYDDELAMESSSSKMKFQNFLNDHGIKPGGGSKHRAFIGFSEKEQKWYGWGIGSCGFKIGDNIKKGHIVYPKMGECELKTLEDCKMAAIYYSRAVRQ